MPGFLAVPLLVAVGLAVGSFLNVCIYRLPRGQSLVGPRSFCPACGRSLRWRENVPLVAYFVLRGRCATCGARIPAMYPLVEGVTAGLFLVFYRELGWQPLLVSRLVLAAALVALFVIDLQHRVLPNKITLPGIVVGFAFSLFLQPGWMSALVGIALGAGIPLVVAEAYYRVRGEEGLGMGDVKMLAMVGAFLGWQLMVLTLVLASLLGSVFGLVLILARRASMRYALPFGTFLAAGAIVAGLVGDSLLDWYLAFY